MIHRQRQGPADPRSARATPGAVRGALRLGGRVLGVLSMGALAALGSACSAQQSRPDPTLMDSLAELEIRIRLLQSELADVRRTLSDRERERDDRAGVSDHTAAQADSALQSRFDVLEQRLDALPGELSGLCPSSPPSAFANAQCEPDIRRVVVSGDRLVVGEVERVWVDPPGSFLLARIDPTVEFSFIHADEVVEFERDGSRWVRFGITVGAETTSIERPLKRFVRARNERRPVVDLRVQIGDVRETLEFAPADLSGQEQAAVLGRNFLTDVALLDVGKRHVQPAPRGPDGG